MNTKLKQMLRTPDLPNDEDSRIAQVLNLIIVATLAIHPLYIFLLFLTLPDPYFKVGATVLLFISEVVIWRVMHRGKIRAASIALLIAFWLYFNVVIALFGGSRSPGVIGFFLIILVSGLLLNRRALFFFSVLSIIAGLGFAYLEVNHALPPSLITITTFYSWMGFILFIVVFAILLNLVTQNLDAAVAKVRASADALQEKNMQLEAAQLSLTKYVAELKAKESDLRLSEERLRAVVHNAPIILWVTDVEGKLTLLQGNTLTQIGVTSERFVGKSIFDVSIGHVANMKEKFQEALAGRTVMSVEVIRDRVLEMRYSPLRDDQKDIIGVLGVATDVTEREQMEEALRQAQKLESLGLLAGGIAHDFNNLLVAMMSQNSLALRLMGEEHRAAKHVEKALRASARAADLTRQMLAFAGKNKYVMTPVSDRKSTRLNSSHH